MDRIESFIRTSNVAHYMDKLRSADLADSTRATLLRLLIEEEDRLGRHHEQLDNAERWVSDGKMRVESVARLMDEPSLKPADRAQAERLLTNLQELQALLEDHCRRVRDRVENSEL